MKKREWLKDLRKEKGFNQVQLANELGIGKSYLSEIEQGNRTPSGYLALKISRILDFRMDLFFETDPETESEVEKEPELT